MKWYITRKRLLAIIVILFLTLAAFGMWGCTKRQEADAKKTGGAVGTLFGLPPVVGESLVGLVLLITHGVSAKLGHGRGRKRERACHIPKASP